MSTFPRRRLLIPSGQARRWRGDRCADPRLFVDARPLRERGDLFGHNSRDRQWLRTQERLDLIHDQRPGGQPSTCLRGDPGSNRRAQANAPARRRALCLRSGSARAGASLQPGSGRSVGRSIDPVSGLFTWTLPAGQHVGSYPVGVVVTDSGSPQLSQSASFTVNVFDLGAAPTIKRASVRTKGGYAITLKFSQPLDAATAGNSNNYILIPIVPKKSKQRPPRQSRFLRAITPRRT